MNTIYNFQVCKKYHQTRTKALYNTICKEIKKRNEKFYLISGFEQIDEIPVLRLTEDDDYHSAIEKTLRCFTYHKNNNTPFDFIFFGDDDTFINLKNLEMFANTIDKNILAIYGSVHNMWFKQDEHAEDIFCTGGPGFIMNRKTFEIVVKAIEKYQIRDKYHSDVSLAFNIHKYNSENSEKIEFINIKGFEQDHRFIIENTRIQRQNFKNIITYHLREWLTNVDDYNETLEIYNKINKYPKYEKVETNIGNDIKIISAKFHDLDVTNILINEIKDNKLKINANIKKFGDPLPYTVKKLNVTYSYNNIVKNISVIENEDLILPSEEHLDILYAEYYNIDVTSILKSKVKNNQISIKACNEIFTDPKFGVIKTLYVEYYYKGKIYYTEIGENEILHIPEKKIDYIISSTYNFYEKTLPVLIPSLLESGISPSNIKIYVGGSNIEYIDSYLNCYIKFVQHNSFDYTSFIEYVDENWDSDWIFSLHDTCKVTNDFRYKVECFDMNYDATYPTNSFMGVCNFGMYNKKILTQKYDKIKNLINCSKDVAILNEGFLFKGLNKIDIYPNDNYHNTLYSNFIFDNKTYDGINRKVEYFENIGLYKYKANWGLDKNVNINVTEL